MQEYYFKILIFGAEGQGLRKSKTQKMMKEQKKITHSNLFE